MLTLVIALLLGQQIGKFDDRPPAFEKVAAKSLEEVERCVIRFGSPPMVYRQPDRPDDVMIVWMASGVSSGNAAGRVDLHREGGKTRIKSWISSRQIEQCLS